MNKHIYVLIMAGGEGVRFQPLSTPEKPKQFLSFWGNRTFIQQTFDRISGITPASNIYVATNDRYLGLVREQLPEIPEENLIGEPQKKNTAPCIAYASRLIYEKDKHAILIVLPSDHVITKEDEFRKIIDRAVYIAKSRDVLVTLGITPTWPADCYGYIQMDKMIEDDPDGKWNAYTVDRFVEKPSVSKAKEYIEEGKFVWNSGMFIWKTAMILNEVAAHLPKMDELLDKYIPEHNLNAFFKDVESISIDYGVMEKSKRVVTISCNIGWSDIGTWQSLYKLTESTGIKLEPKIAKLMKEQIECS